MGFKACIDETLAGVLGWSQGGRAPVVQAGRKGAALR